MHKLTHEVISSAENWLETAIKPFTIKSLNRQSTLIQKACVYYFQTLISQPQWQAQATATHRYAHAHVIVAALLLFVQISEIVSVPQCPMSNTKIQVCNIFIIKCGN